jgi:hypothetical protein
MKASTQGVYRNIIDRFCEEADKKGHKYGDKHAATLRRENVIALMTLRRRYGASAFHCAQIRPGLWQRGRSHGL